MTTLTVKRPNGKIETVDISERFPASINKAMFENIKKGTKDAGRGDVLEATITHKKSNMPKLMTEYNNLNNEGGEGYVPEPSYFEAKAEFKSWTETTTIK